ncbi:MAG: sugar ABC transporter permease [Synergistaceae bacterium]|nr:sugar ABC transporter permease [Synergistaceae bacterium]
MSGESTNKYQEAGLESRIPFYLRARPYFILAPALIITIGIMYPFFLAVYYSMTNFSFRLPSYKFIGLKNYITMFSSVDFWHSLWVTVLYGFVTTASELALGTVVAMLLSKSDNPFTRVLKVSLIFPLMIPPVIATLVWQLMTNKAVGILEKMFRIINIYNFPWASSPRTALFTVALIDIWVYTPFMMILVLAGIQSLPKSPFEAARIDGGGAFFTFRALTLPLLAPYMLIAVIFRLMAAFQEFTIIYALTKGGPGDTLMNLSITAYLKGFTFQKLGAALPYILVLWIIVFFVSQKLVKRWLTMRKFASGD